MILPFSLLRRTKYAFNGLRYYLNVRQQLSNRAFVKSGIAGPLPLPPPKLAFLVQWSYDLRYHYESGKLGYACIRDSLARCGYRPSDFREILDFGCGCGRLLRHWEKGTKQRLSGADYNPELIAWCRINLVSIAECFVCGAMPPLGWHTDKFDFIYASSVFTHFNRQQQYVWMVELHRILRPGGLLLITVSGITRLHHLSVQERTVFHGGYLVVQRPALAGTNICGVYHPKQYVLDLTEDRFVVLDHEIGGAIDQNQDIYLLRKCRK